MTVIMSSKRSAPFVVALLIGLVAGACGPHSEWRIEHTCEDYCARSVDCNDNVGYDDCVDDCIATADDCDSESDLEQALDILEGCPDEACNDLAGCVAEAFVECAF